MADLRARLDADPSDGDALEALEARCVEAADYGALASAYEGLIVDAQLERALELAERLASLLERSGRAAGSPRDGGELLRRAANLFAAPLLDGERTAEALSAAWTRHPDGAIVGDAQELVPSTPTPTWLLSARAAVSEGDVRLAMLQQLASRHLEGDALNEAQRLYEEIASLKADDAAAKSGLAAIGDLRALRSRAVEEARADAEAAGLSGAEAAGAWTRLADVLTAAEAFEEAEEALRQAVRAGGARDAEARLERVLRREERLPELVELLGGLLEGGAADAAEQSRVRRRLFRVLTELGRHEEAGEHLAATAAGEAVDVERSLSRAALAGEAADWERAAGILEAASATATDGDERITVLTELGRVCSEELGDDELAERAYRRLRLADPRSVAALRFYRRWYGDRGDHRSAYAGLVQLVNILSGPAERSERLSLAREMALVAEEHLDSPERALEAWRRVLADDPTNSRANEKVAGLYAGSRRWQAAVDHLERWLRALPEDGVDARTDLLFRIIDIYQSPERLPNEDLVVATYRRIVALAPDNRRALDGLVSRYEDREQHQQLLRVLQHRLETASDPETLIDVFGQLATLFVDKIRSDVQAIPVLERLLELEPSNLAIVQRLREIHQRRHDSRRLYDTYRHELELLDGADRLGVLTELARLATDELLLHDEAIDWWRKVLVEEPRHPGAQQALQNLHADRDDWEGYAQVLEARLAEVTTKKARVELLQELGEVAYTRLADPDRALERFRRVCEIAPFNPRARNFIQRIYVARRAWDELSGLFAPRSDWKGYVDLLDDAAKSSPDPGLVADVLIEAARAARDELGQHREALKRLERALEAAPERADIAQMLLARFESSTPRAKRIAALDTVARYSPDSAERLDAWEQLGGLFEREGDGLRRLEALSEAARLAAPDGDIDGLPALAELGAELNELDRVIELFAEVLAHLPEAAREARAEVHRRLGRLYARFTRDDEHLARAVTHFRYVLQLAPGDADSLAALENIHLGRNDLDGLEQVYQACTESADPNMRIRALRELARLYYTRTDNDLAATTYLTLLEESPDDEDALDALHDVLADSPAELVAALESVLVTSITDERRAELRLELAQLYRVQLADPAAAVEHYRDLQAEQPGAVEAVLEALEGMLDAPAERVCALPLLEAHYRAHSMVSELVRVLRRRADDAADPQIRREVLAELAFLAQDVLERFDVAFLTQQDRFLDDPADRTIWDDLTSLAERLGTWSELATCWQRTLDDGGVEDAADVGALRRRLATVLDGRLGDVTGATAVLESILDSEGETAGQELLERLEGLYERSDSLEGLVKVRLALADAARTGVARRTKLLEACELLAGPLDRASEAVGHLETLAAEQPEDSVTAARLEALYAATGAYQQLADHLDARVGAVADEELQDRLRFRAALLRRDELDDGSGSVDRLLQLAGSASVGPQVRELLLQVARAEVTDQAIRKQAITALESWYASGEDPEGAVELLELQAEIAAPGPARARLQRQAADLLLAGGDLADVPLERAEQAFERLARALEEHPGDRKALQTLGVLVDRVRGHARFIELLEGCAERTEVAAVAIGLRRQAAEVAEGQLEDYERAIGIWERITTDALAGSSDEAKALDALDGLYERTGAVDRRIEVLGTKAERARKPTARLPLMLQRGQLLRSSGRVDEAIEAFQRVRKATGLKPKGAPGELRSEATAELERILADERHWEALVALLVGDAEVLGSPGTPETRARLTRAAEIARTELGDLAQAIGLYERIHEALPDDAEALDALDRLYQQTERWEDKARVLEIRLEAARGEGDHERHLQLLFTLGQLYENRLERPLEALSGYSRILTQRPDFAPALAVLNAHARRGAFPAAARRHLARAYRVTDSYRLLVDTLQAALDAQDDELDVGALHEEIAHVRSGALGEPTEAWPHAVAAYRVSPKSTDRRALVLALAQPAGQVPELPGVLAAVASQLDEASDRQAQRLADIATLGELKLGDAAVLPLWKAVLAEDPHHGDALAHLEEAARSSGDPERLAELLKARIARSDSSDDPRALRLEMVDLLVNVPARAADAVALLEGMRDEDPADAEVAERLCESYRTHGRHADLAALLEARLAASSGESAAVLRKQLAEVMWVSLGDAGRSVELYGALLRDAPEDEDARAALDAIWEHGAERGPILAILEPALSASESWEALAQRYEELQDEGQAEELADEALERLSLLHAQRLEQPEEAYEAMRRLVARGGGTAARLDRLEALAVGAHGDDGLDDVLGVLEGVAGEATAAGTHDRVAALAIRLEQPGRAIAAHRAALELEPERAASVEALRGLLAQTEDWDGLVDLLRGSAEQAEGAARVALLDAQVEILTERLERPDDAVRVLREVAQVSGRSPDRDERIADLLERAGRSEALEAHLRDWLGEAGEGAEAVAVRIRLAAVLMSDDARRAEGIAEMGRVLEARPDSKAAAAGLVSAFRALASAEERGKRSEASVAAAAAAVAPALALALGDEATVDERRILARTELRGCEDGARRRVLLRELGDLDRNDGREPEAFRWYQQALAQLPTGDVDIEAAMEAAALAGGQAEALASFLEVRVERGGDDAERLLERLATLTDRTLGRASQAAAYYERLLATQPGRVDVLERLAEIQRESGDRAAEADALKRWLEHSSSGADLEALRLRLAILCMDHLGDEDGAIALLEASLPDGAKNPELRRRLERLYGVRSKFQGLLSLYEAALAAESETSARIELLAKVSQIAELRLGELDRAREACRAILELDAGHRFALTSLERVEQGREDWRGLDEVLRSRSDHAVDDAERVRILISRAELALTRFEDSAAALELLSQADALGGAGAGPDGLIEALTALLGDGDVRRDAALMLRPRLEARGSWRALRRVLEVAYASATDAAERERLAVDAAKVASERLGDPAAAIGFVGGELRRQPRSALLKGVLAELSAASDQPTGVLGALRGALEALGEGDPGYRAELLRWVGRVERDGRGDLEAATAAYEEAVRLDGGDGEARQALEALYRRAGRWRELQSVMADRLEGCSVEERPRLLFEIATMVREESGAEQAITVLADLLEADPKHAEGLAMLTELAREASVADAALAMLEATHRRTSAWAELAMVLAMRAERMPAGPDRAALWAEAGDLYDSHLNLEEPAFKAYRRAVIEDPSQQDALRRLQRIAHKWSMWRELAETLDEMAAKADEGRRRDLLLQLAQIQEIKLGKADRAIDTLYEVLELDEHHRAALVGLRRLYQRTGQLRELVEVTNLCAELALSDQERKSFWTDVYKLAHSAGDRATMIEACESALELDPYDSDVTDLLAPLYEAAQRYGDLDKMWATEAEGTGDPARLGQLHMALGRVRETLLRDIDRAAEAYRAAWDADPSLSAAGDWLERHYRDADDVAHLASLLASRTSVPGLAATKAIAWHLEFAGLAETQLGDLAEAVRAYESILVLDATHEQALDELIRIFHKHQKWEQLAGLYERKARSVRGATERQSLLVLAAEVYAIHLGEWDTAESLLQTVLASNARHAKAQGLLAQVEAQRGRPRQAVALLERLLEDTQGPERFELLLNLGQLAAARLEAPQRALQALLEARELSPDDPRLTTALREVFERTGSWEDLILLLEREFETLRGAKARCRQALTIARLYDEHATDDERYLHWLGQAAEARRDSPEVADAYVAFYLARERWEEAAARLEWLVSYLEAKKVVDQLPQRAHQLGGIFERLGQPAKAAEYYKITLQAAPKHLPNLLDYGDLLIRTRQWDKAVRVHTNLLMQIRDLTDDAKRDQVLYNLALASLELGDKAKAKRYMKRLLKVNPSHAGAAALESRLD